MLAGRGDGTFGKTITQLGLNTPGPVVTGDFNGDGRADIALTNGSGGQSIFIYLR